MWIYQLERYQIYLASAYRICVTTDCTRKFMTRPYRQT